MPAHESVRGAVHVAPEVADALAAGHPVVALESSVLAQGLPVPANREAAERMTRFAFEDLFVGFAHACGTRPSARYGVGPPCSRRIAVA